MIEGTREDFKKIVRCCGREKNKIMAAVITAGAIILLIAAAAFFLAKFLNKSEEYDFDDFGYDEDDADYDYAGDGCYFADEKDFEK